MKFVNDSVFYSLASTIELSQKNITVIIEIGHLFLILKFIFVQKQLGTVSTRTNDTEIILW